jgi:hypothetical protein
VHHPESIMDFDKPAPAKTYSRLELASAGVAAILGPTVALIAANTDNKLGKAVLFLGAVSFMAGTISRTLIPRMKAAAADLKRQQLLNPTLPRDGDIKRSHMITLLGGTVVLPLAAATALAAAMPAVYQAGGVGLTGLVGVGLPLLAGHLMGPAVIKAMAALIRPGMEKEEGFRYSNMADRARQRRAAKDDEAVQDFVEKGIRQGTFKP